MIEYQLVGWFSINVANLIEKLQWDFLWSGLSEEFKFYQVNKTNVCSPIFKEWF